MAETCRSPKDADMPVNTGCSQGLSRFLKTSRMVPATGLEPVRCYSLEPESSASANSATRACRSPHLHTRHWRSAGFQGTGPASASGRKCRANMPIITPEASRFDAASGNRSRNAQTQRAQPRYTHRAAQVSATTTSLSKGRRGLSRRQIHVAMFSLVGFSSPGTRLR